DRDSPGALPGFPWHNTEHRHGGLGLHTAADVHHGRAAAVRAGRALVLTDAYRAHPERLARRPPAPPSCGPAPGSTHPMTGQKRKPPLPVSTRNGASFRLTDSAVDTAD